MQIYYHKKLLEQAFAKESARLQEYGVGLVTNTQITTNLATYIQEALNYPLNERTLRNYWNRFEENPAFQIPQAAVLDGLASYLGFPDYSVWLVAQKVQEPPKKDNSRKKLYVIFIVTLVLLAIVVGTYNYVTRERWMQWEQDHYVEVSFDPELLEQGVLKRYKEDRILHFFKKEPIDIPAYFDANNQPLIWYGKNRDGVYEYFTDLGLHPETGKTLKPITQYIIDKYISPVPK